MPILTQTARRILGSCAGLLTQDCLLCGASSGASLICSACEADLPQLPVRLCPRCALPTPAGEICGRCLAKPPHYDLTLAALRYDFPLDKLVQSFNSRSSTVIAWLWPATSVADLQRCW